VTVPIRIVSRLFLKRRTGMRLAPGPGSRFRNANLTIMALVIRRSGIHGDGVYTTTPIKRRALVAEYTGPRLTNSQADDIYEDSPRTYLFGLVDGEHVV